MGLIAVLHNRLALFPELVKKNMKLQVLLIVMLGFFVYSNTFRVPFVFDDLFNISDNYIVKDLNNFKNPFSTEVSADRTTNFLRNGLRIRYIGYLTFALNYQMHGLNVFGYHAANLFIHIMSALLVYWLVFLTFRTPYFTASNYTLNDRSTLIAFLTATLFVCHPIQTQAVTYIIQRFASLATMFYLLSLVLYVKFRLGQESRIQSQESADSGLPFKNQNSPTVSRQGRKLGAEAKFKMRLFYLGSLLSAVLAMKTKEMAFTLPFIITLYEYAFLEDNFKKKVSYLIPYFLTLMIIPLSIADANRPFADILSNADSLARYDMKISRVDYLLTQFTVIVKYIRLMFPPMVQNLDYDYPVYNSFFEPDVFSSFLFLTAVMGLGVYLFSSSRLNRNGSRVTGPGSRLIAFGIFWFFITISMESSIFPLEDVIFEHRVYLPSTGFFIALIVLVMIAKDKLNVRMPILAKSVMPVLAVIILILAGSAYARNGIWRTEIKLWEDTAEKSPGKYRPHNNLGSYFASHGLYIEAAEEFRAAIKIRPDYADAHNNLGVACLNQGLFDEAMDEFRIAIEINSDYPDALNNLGLAYIKKGRPEEALIQLQQAIALKPNYPQAHYNMGLAYENLGNFERAVEEYTRTIMIKPDYIDASRRIQSVTSSSAGLLENAVRKDPGNAILRFNLGAAYHGLSNIEYAIREYRNAIRLNPNYIEAYNNLGVALSDKGVYDESVKELESAIKIKRDYADPHNNLGVVYEKMGMPDKAVAEYLTAVKIKPDYADARCNLGAYYTRSGRIEDAIRELQTALSLRPDLPRIHFNIAMAYEKKGLLDRAVEEYQAAVKSKPDYTEALSRLEKVVSLKIKLLEEALSKDRDNIILGYNLGVVYHSFGYYDKAVRKYKDVVRLKPDHADAHANLGAAYAKLGRINDSITELKIALQLKPDDVDIKNNLENSYNELKYRR